MPNFPLPDLTSFLIALDSHPTGSITLICLTLLLTQLWSRKDK